MSEDPYVRVGAPPAPTQKRSNRRRVLVLVLVAVAALGGAAGIGGGIIFAMVQAGKIDNPLSRSFTVEGTVTLEHGDFVTTDDSCFGDGGYDDMHLGTQVVVTDANEKTIAIGEIVAAEDAATECRLTFRVEDVPRGEDFYGIEVSHRGRLQYAADDLERPLSLSLG